MSKVGDPTRQSLETDYEYSTKVEREEPSSSDDEGRKVPLKSRHKKPKQINMFEVLDIEDVMQGYEDRRPQPQDEREEVPFDLEKPERVMRISYNMDVEHLELLIALLREFVDVFAWLPLDMPGLGTSVAVHRLNVYPEAKPVKQKKRNFSPEKITAIREEVDKLIEAGCIETVYYPDWVANVVLVKKTSGEWRMCIDLLTLIKLVLKIVSRFRI
ncbi:hypothetical protein LIER_02384 [Lithospermum erythrorhizon]|uniref:Uncharacterized protein n=1 Tax=Lithospermum erythrorhizon TaxID=34254 RepID=A0AAV3NPA4_LITER